MPLLVYRFEAFKTEHIGLRIEIPSNNQCRLIVLLLLVGTLCKLIYVFKKLSN